MILLCRTLFDITKTNVSNRRKTMDMITSEIIKQRNQQSNYETIIQIISLRSLPENISEPKIIQTNLRTFGISTNCDVKCWEFEFEVLQNSVFSDGSNELAKLYHDCLDVPMIIGLEEMKDLTPALSYNNIYFEIIKNELRR